MDRSNFRLVPTDAVLYIGDHAFHFDSRCLPPELQKRITCSHEARRITVTRDADGFRAWHFTCDCGHALSGAEIAARCDRLREMTVVE